MKTQALLLVCGFLSAISQPLAGQHRHTHPPVDPSPAQNKVQIAQFGK
jgi:hypothetical protein